MNNDSQAARRAFWTQQMNQAYDFMQQMRSYPVAECGEPLFSMREAAADNLEVAFSDTKIALDLDRIYFLRAGLRDNFLGAARAMNERGWILKIEEGFRSVEMQTQLSRKPQVFDAILKTTIWELGGETPSPEFFLKRLAALTAIRPSVGTHMSGSAIDISVLRRDDGLEVERGGPYLEMSELTPMASPFAAPQNQENRRDIEQIMSQNGFFAYPFEFWHFNSGDGYAEFLGETGQPARYGPVHLNQSDGSVTPIEDPDQALQTPEIMQREIAASMARSGFVA